MTIDWHPPGMKGIGVTSSEYPKTIVKDERVLAQRKANSATIE